MMGRQDRDQGQLFYEFSLDEMIPADHLLRRINVFATAVLADLHQQLKPFYSDLGRPSVDPELMIRMLLVGYCYGIRHERRLCQEVALHLAYRWFCKLDLDDKVPHHSTFSVNRQVFVSPEILFDEERRIFDKCWIYVGHASELKQPNDFRTRQVAGRPVIFTRDRQGTIRALLNVCRHRGALVCREREGNARQFYCIYHGWSYNTDGSIKGIPGDEAYPPNFDKKGKGLVRGVHAEIRTVSNAT